MRKISLLVSAFLTGSILISGCNNADRSNVNDNSESRSAFDLTAVKKDIEETNRQFMDLFAKGDSAGIADLYTTDAEFMGAGGPPVTGKTNIQSAMSGMIRSGVTKVDFSTKDIFGCEDLVAEEGVATLFVQDKVVGEEKYIVLWKKEDGKWKLFRDIFNSNLPAPASK